MSEICPICNNEITPGAAKCESCGFHLLGSTQSFTPVKMNPDGSLLKEDEKQKFEFKVIRGPQTGVDIALKGGVMSIGRDPQCDIFLNDMTVSRKHATIEVGGKGCVIRDENSFNGTWINDRMEEACLLKPGDVIQIGVFCLIYRERA